MTCNICKLGLQWMSWGQTYFYQRQLISDLHEEGVFCPFLPLYSTILYCVFVYLCQIFVHFTMWVLVYFFLFACFFLLDL